jgi:hypothetical protein
MSGMTRSLLIVAAVGAALVLGACGGSDDGGGAGGAKSQEDKAFEGALKYARCMREHGIDMPDPQQVANGIKITQKATPGSQAKMQSAQKACQKYLKAGGGRAPSAAEQARARDALLAYTRCMREEGVKIADPEFSKGGSLSSVGGPGQTNPKSPKFKAADEVCHKYLAEVEGPGAGTEEKK